MKRTELQRQVEPRDWLDEERRLTRREKICEVIETIALSVGVVVAVLFAWMILMLGWLI
jgi:hypothetical protein